MAQDKFNCNTVPIRTEETTGGGCEHDGATRAIATLRGK